MSENTISKESMDRFFNMDYVADDYSERVYTHAECAHALMYKFEHQVLQETCYKCGKTALLEIVKALGENEALLEYLPATVMAETLEFVLLYKMFNAVLDGTMTDYITFLYMYQREYIKLCDEDPVSQMFFFADTTWVEKAESGENPQRPITDIAVFLDGLGPLGALVHTIATSKKAKRIDKAFVQLRQEEDLESACIVLRRELLNIVLFELHRHNFLRGKLPKALKLQLLILRLIMRRKAVCSDE